MSSFCWQWETVSFIHATTKKLKKKKHFIHSFLLKIEDRVISRTAENDCASAAAASGLYAKAVSLGLKFCATFFFFPPLFFLLAVC